MKNIRKLCGSLLLLCALFLNVICANAAVTMKISSVTDKSHSLGFVESKNFDYGKVTFEIVSVSKNVLTAKLSIVNSGSGEGANGPQVLPGANMAIYLPDDIVNNFTIALGESSSHANPAYNDGDSIINWSIPGEIPVGDTAYMTYTITPKSSYSETILNSTLYIATSINGQIQANTEGSSYNVEFNQELGCIPAFTMSNGSTPNTGIFTNIALLSGIVLAASGILVVSLKKNKFQNI